MAVKNAVIGLPTKKKKPITSIETFTCCLYGREKIGKTTLASQWPEVLFLSTEPGTKGMEIYEFNHENGGVKNWDLLIDAVDLLERTNDFKTIAIDTIDRAYDMCLDYVCTNLGVDYPGKSADGKEDFGKSWSKVKKEFLYQIHRIIQSGRGIIFVSHAKELEIKTRSGEKYTKIVPSMSNQARVVIEALVDLFFYAEYVKDIHGNNRRILVCEGDDTIWAGARKTGDIDFPQYLPLGKEDGYDIIQAAFLGEDVGLDPAELFASKATSKTGKSFVDKQRMETKRGERK